jgi:hypothetical protein
VTRHDDGDRYDVILLHIETVRATLLERGVDPDEVAGEIKPDLSPNSCYRAVAYCHPRRGGDRCQGLGLLMIHPPAARSSLTRRRAHLIASV